MAVHVRHEEPRWIMLARENTPAGQTINERISITARYEHALTLNAGWVFPDDGDPVCRILAGKPKHFGPARGAHLLQTNKTDANQRKAVIQLWTKRRRKNGLDDGGIGSEIDEQPPFDCACYDGDAHATSFAKYSICGKLTFSPAHGLTAEVGLDGISHLGEDFGEFGFGG